jgi:hypothetical protein
MSDELKGYIYIRDNEWYKLSNVYKIGITNSIENETDIYKITDLYSGFYIKIYEINIKIISLIYNLLQSEFKHRCSNNDFYDRNIILDIETFFKNYTFLYVSKTDNEIMRINRKSHIYNNYYKLVSKMFIILQNNNLREYQITAISFIITQLKLNNRCYLHLATGAGKSKIAINIMNTIKPMNILIFSPRIILNNENDKYLQILKDYKLFNNDNGNVKNYNIINYCYQSCKNAYELIIKNDIRNLFVWFDESQYAINSWITNQSNDYKKFFINDTNFISYRLFTSAISDREFIYKNANIYGILYEPIKLHKLQEKCYLTTIELEIFDKDYNNLLITTFNYPNKQRNMGISFHNSCCSAYSAYTLHLKLFKENKTDIKPHLLINEDIIKKQKDNLMNDENFEINHKDDLKNIKKIKKDITNYNYYNEITSFENNYFNNQKTIAYQVVKYSMGYNCKLIDILYFTDIKLVYTDVIKSIDRGMQINNDKYLRIILVANMIHYDNIYKYIVEELKIQPQIIKNIL